MAVENGYKFVYVVVPIFLVACALIFIYLNKKDDIFSQLGNNDPENIVDEISNGKEESDMDFSELEIQTTTEGTGNSAVDGDTLVVHYEGTLRNGKVFDSSFERGIPYEFILGSGQVISGWDEGLKGMKVGEERVLNIPSSMAYGSNDGALIPANSGLIFKVKLVEIK
jgi:FKBP-type peptidyl-prolyl cis-trans isomerase